MWFLGQSFKEPYIKGISAHLIIMKIYILLTTLWTVFLLTSCKTIRTRDCEGTIYGSTTKVEVDPCPREPCVLTRGNNSTIKVHFSPSETSTTLDIALKGKIGPLWIPFPLSVKNVCTAAVGSECHCPLEKGGTYVASKTIPVSTTFPQIKVEISVQLQNQKDHDVSCVEFLVVLE